eukprot:CAMPEP_0181102102 /NCGR_PEP_ID=MMETSP1071-20121207/14128_1 /TAXON_ID=35127 /ORGANISM="Thalassiosira sp., Strain NH16" /LENGTH=971 /DNA_ID=CAMNT_0023185037 /DNA_START=77 /DNA_END=2992 /DNA_ORIENTATION=-
MRCSPSKVALLGTALVFSTFDNDVTAASTTTTNIRSSSDASSASASSALKRFFDWHVDAVFSRNDNDNEETSSASSWFDRRLSGDEPSVLFSFTLSGEKVERYRKLKATRRQTVEAGHALSVWKTEDEDGTAAQQHRQQQHGRRLAEEETQSGRGLVDMLDTSSALEAAEALDKKFDMGSVLGAYNDKSDQVAGEVHEAGHGGGTDEHGSAHVADGLAAETTHSDSHGDDGAHSDAHEMVVHVTYADIYAILLFLIIATAAGIFTAKLGMPALVGEIFVGFLLGPPLADFVPFPEALVLVGEIGLIMLLLEAGVELDVAQLRETGTRALAIGLTGTALPLLVGMGLGMASGNSSVKSALAVGASFSPTSLGVAASALKSGKMLDTPVGQLIVASCVVDDVLALILLSLFKVLVKDNPPIIQYFIPIISSVGFLIVLGGSAVTWMPRFIENKILKPLPESMRELAMFSVMIVMLLAYLPLLNYTQASYLTGAFLAGCTFSQIDSAHHAFMDKTHQLMTWLLRVFFAASIGFQVPVKLFGDPWVIGWGFILYLCVAAKLPLAFYVPQFEDVKEDASYNPFLRDRVITALAMTCRGEFSFIIAAFALGEGLFTAQMYAAIVWAVLLSCITSPFMLLNLIEYFNKKQLAYLASTNPIKLAKDGDGSTPLFLHVKAKAPAFGGMQEKFRKILNELGLEVVERRTNRNGRGLDATVQTDLYVRDTTMSVQLQKIGAQRKIKHALDHANEASGNSAMSKSMSFCRQGSMRVSSDSLSNVSLNSLGKNEQEAIKRSAEEEDGIIKRGDHVEKMIEQALGEDAEVIVDVWNPWPWTEVLDSICEHYGLSGNGGESIDTFVAIFDKIDTDGGGEIDQEEMYDALTAAGLDITEEGVITLVAMIDEDGNGDIDREEWKETIKFYLELKEEEEEMQKQQSDQALFMKNLRAKKLEALMGDKARDVSAPILEDKSDDVGMDVDA